MKNIIGLFFIIVMSIGCKGRNVNESTEMEIANKAKSISLIDSLKSICRENTVDTFDIENLETDDFSKMIHIDKKLFQTIYPKRDDFSKNSFFIYSYIPTNHNYLTLITYQKNYEGENYRVDHIDLVNIDSKGNQLDKIRLTTKDNEVITYEVVSLLVKGTLKIVEQVSSEPYFNPDLDTLYTNKITLKLNGEKRIDTVKVEKSFEVRKY